LHVHGLRSSRKQIAELIGVAPETTSVWKRHAQWQNGSAAPRSTTRCSPTASAVILAVAINAVAGLLGG
jgi:transposase-like protein